MVIKISTKKSFRYEDTIQSVSSLPAGWRAIGCDVEGEIREVDVIAIATVQRKWFDSEGPASGDIQAAEVNAIPMVVDVNEPGLVSLLTDFDISEDWNSLDLLPPGKSKERAHDEMAKNHRDSFAALLESQAARIHKLVLTRGQVPASELIDDSDRWNRAASLKARSELTKAKQIATFKVGEDVTYRLGEGE